MAEAIIAAVTYVGEAFAAADGGTATLAQTITVAAVQTAAAVGTQAVVAQLGKQRAEGSATDFRLDIDAGLPFAFGRVGVGGVLAYRKGFGPTNRYQALISTVCAAGPIKSWVSFKADNEVTTFGAGDLATSGDHSGAMWLQRKLGTQPETAHTSPAGLDDGATAPGWTSDHKMSGRATAMWTLYENSKMTEYKGGVPKQLHVIEGKYGWDPRLDDTWPGGEGDCRLDDPETWVWIDEGCIAALNWAIGMWEGDSGGGAYGVPYACSLVGGIGSSLEGIDVAALINGANVADANGWKLAAYPTTKDDKYQVYAQLLQASGCVPARKAGQISCVCPAEESASIVTVTAADTAGPVEVSLGQSRLERRNTALPRYWSEDADWQMVQIAPISDAAWVTDDGGKRTRPADYPYVPDADQAAQLAYYDLANDREAITGTIPFKPHMRQIAPGDCFTFDEPGFLLDGIKVRCLKRSYDPMAQIARITFRQETDAKHTAALAQVGVAPSSGTPGSPPSDIVDPPTAFTATVSDDEVTLEWTVGEANYFRTLIHISDTDDFSTASQIGSLGYLAGATQTWKHKPGDGTWYYWVQGRDFRGDVSTESASEEAIVGLSAALGALAVLDKTDTADIEDDAVTNELAAETSAAQTLSGTSFVTIQTLTYVSTGAPIEVRANFFMTVWHPSGGDISARVRITRNTVGNIFDRTYTAIGGDFIQGWQTPIVIDTPAAGTWDYEVIVSLSNNDASTEEVQDVLLLLREYKR